MEKQFIELKNGEPFFNIVMEGLRGDLPSPIF